MDNSQLYLPIVLLCLLISLMLLVGFIIPLLNRKICQNKDRLILTEILEEGKTEGQVKNVTVVMPQFNIQKKTIFYKENHYPEEISDNDFLYGTFRLRPEDALEIIPPKHLPPICHTNHGISEASFLIALQRMKHHQEHQLYRNLSKRSQSQQSKPVIILDDVETHAFYRMDPCHNRYKRSISQPEIFLRSYHIYDERMKFGDYIKYDEVDKEIFY